MAASVKIFFYCSFNWVVALILSAAAYTKFYCKQDYNPEAKVVNFANPIGMVARIDLYGE